MPKLVTSNMCAPTTQIIVYGCMVSIRVIIFGTHGTLLKNRKYREFSTRLCDATNFITKSALFLQQKHVIIIDKNRYREWWRTILIDNYLFVHWFALDVFKLFKYFAALDLWRLLLQRHLHPRCLRPQDLGQRAEHYCCFNAIQVNNIKGVIHQWRHDSKGHIVF